MHSTVGFEIPHGISKRIKHNEQIDVINPQGSSEMRMHLASSYLQTTRVFKQNDCFELTAGLISPDAI